MKTLEQTTDEARAVAMLRALANPARFRIVQLLAARNECIVGDLVEALPLSQSSVSEHLAVLKDAGIVQGTVDGPQPLLLPRPRRPRLPAGRARRHRAAGVLLRE